MIRFGKVVATDPKRGKVRVQIEDADAVVTFWLPVLQSKTHKDKFYYMPDIGELVACAFYQDDWDTGVVLGSVYNQVDTVPVASQDKVHIRFSDGTELEYDRASHKLKADVKGDVLIKASGQVEIEAEVLIKGNLDVVGNIHATGSIIDEGGNTSHHSH